MHDPKELVLLTARHGEKSRINILADFGEVCLSNERYVVSAFTDIKTVHYSINNIHPPHAKRQWVLYLLC